MLETMYTSGWGNIAARYATIKIKGYSITRMILAIDCAGAAVPIAPEYPFVQFVYRFDRNIPYALAAEG